MVSIYPPLPMVQWQICRGPPSLRGQNNLFWEPYILHSPVQLLYFKFGFFSVEHEASSSENVQGPLRKRSSSRDRQPPHIIAYIMQMKNDTYITLLNSTKIYQSSHPNYWTPKEGMEKVRQGGYAYYTVESSAYGIISRTFDNRQICNLEKVIFIPASPVGLHLPKKSQYTELFHISKLIVIVCLYNGLAAVDYLQCTENFNFRKVSCFSDDEGEWYTQEDRFKLYKIFSQHELGIRIAFLPIQKGCYKNSSDEFYEKRSFILDLSCENAKTVLEESSQNYKFRQINRWLMIGNSTMAKGDIKLLFDDLQLRMDMNVKVALPKSNGTKYEILEVYDQGIGVDLQINTVGTFQNANLTYFGKIFSLYNSRKNMSGVLIRTANTANYTSSPPENRLIELRQSRVESTEKVHIHLSLVLAEMHQFRLCNEEEETSRHIILECPALTHWRYGLLRIENPRRPFQRKIL
ncbi:hypothetical protein NQ318_019364 [Aromia moschata]|uniref:Ionotropic receptor 75a N-terminal domain-containing protein n=1 Tax=Aromia moschata TaxID=1265417 RepID=A0AAV8XYF0_9CUCU|nr:hypothetical protein NQ318_019364 [Aromia moschata]